MRPPGPPAQIIPCTADERGRIFRSLNVRYPRRIYMTRQISGSPCVQGRTWGVDRRGLWVDRGCRAEFQVRR